MKKSWRDPHKCFPFWGCMRIGLVLLFMVSCLFLPMFALGQEEKPAAPPGGAPPEGKAPPAPQEANSYIVKKGDTLWDLSKQFLNSPFLWPQIWDKNKYIKNPNLIYPGDPLYIPGLEPKVVEAPPPPPPPAPVPAAPSPKKEEAVAEKPPAPVAEAPKVPLVPEKFWRCSGYISEGYPDFPGSIIGSLRAKAVLSLNEIVAIDLGKKEGVKVGDRFDVVRVERKTTRPRGIGSLGYLVKYLGILEVQETAENQSRCRIIYSCEEIQLEDGIVPHKEIALPLEKQLVAAPQPLWGKVIEDKNFAQLHGGRDIVFVDLGTSQGVGPGDILEVYRPEDRNFFVKLLDPGKRTAIEETTPGGKEVLYSVVLGHLLIIRAEPNISTCMILDGSYELQVGFRVKWAQKIKP